METEVRKGRDGTVDKIPEEVEASRSLVAEAEEDVGVAPVEAGAAGVGSLRETLETGLDLEAMA